MRTSEKMALWVAQALRATLDMLPVPPAYYSHYGLFAMGPETCHSASVCLSVKWV